MCDLLGMTNSCATICSGMRQPSTSAGQCSPGPGRADACTNCTVMHLYSEHTWSLGVCAGVMRKLSSWQAWRIGRGACSGPAAERAAPPPPLGLHVSPAPLLQTHSTSV